MESGEENLKNNKVFEVLQRVGRSFMLPIAILPVAGLQKLYYSSNSLPRFPLNYVNILCIFCYSTSGNLLKLNVFIIYYHKSFKQKFVIKNYVIFTMRNNRTCKSACCDNFCLTDFFLDTLNHSVHT